MIILRVILQKALENPVENHSGIWEHDHQDNNGDAHLKAGIVGASETIPIVDFLPGLSTWQNIFLCEFDGPREKREIVVTIIEDK